MDTFNNIVDSVDSFVWGPWLLIPLLLGTGLILTCRLHGVQFRKLGAALRLALFKRKDQGAEGDVSHFQALTTALAATVGVGNILGVSTAIFSGGPGALFWMWVSGLLGMASKYSEAFLGSKYREVDDKGGVIGGPQIYLERGIAGPVGRTLALAFAIFGALAAFGIGNGTQVDAITTNMQSGFGWNPKVTSIVIAVIVGLVVIGGIQVIGKVTAAFVPFMIIVYLVAGAVVLVSCAGQILPALGLVFRDAFTGHAALGGFLGATLKEALRYGVARGIFSNESGMGSAAIVASAAQTSHPVRQGLVSMTQTFIDTIIVVSFTGLVILTSGAWHGPDAGEEGGKQMTSHAFRMVFQSNWGAGAAGWGPKVVAICVVMFALSTVFGWSYYGERCATRLLGIRAQLPYRIIFTLMVIVWGFFHATTIWNIADILNGLMALPNLIGLIILSGAISRETRGYLAKDPDLTKGGVEPSPLRSLRFGRHLSWVPSKSVIHKNPVK